MKKILQLFIPALCLFFSSSIRSQNPGVIQAKNGLYNASIHKEVCYHNGRYYSLGAREITCLDQNLDIVWTTSISSTAIGFSNASKIIITKDGNIVCNGITNRNTFSTYIIKLHPDGTVIFQREYYLPSQNLPSLSMTLFALSPAAGEDEGFVLGGGSCAHNNVLIKCDKNGNIEWAKHHSFPNSTCIQAIYTEGNGYVLISTYPDNSTFNTMIWGADANGDPQWSHFLLTSSSIAPSFPKIRKLSSGQLAFICYPSGICTFDVNGANINLREISTYKPISLNDLAEDNTGDLVICGYVSSVPQNDPGAQRSLCLKLNADNSIPWVRQSQLLPNFGPVLNTVYKTPAGKFSFFGDGAIIATVDPLGNGLCTADSMMMSAIPVTYTETFPGILNTTAHILTDSIPYEAVSVSLNKVTLCNTVGIEELANVIPDLKAYPNPNNGNFNLQLGENFNEGELIIFDQLGREVYAAQIFGGKNDIMPQNLSAGLYHFTVSENHKPFAKGKFMVQ